jgi:hypothetical protein
MRITLPGAMRIGLLLAGLPAAATGSATRAETPTVDPGAATLAAAPHPLPQDSQPRAPLRQATLEFGFYALGAKAFSVKLDLQRDDDAVTVDTSMQTFGLVNFLMSFELTGHIAARLRDGRMLPVRYITNSDGTWSKRSARITWDADGMPVAELQPPVDQDERDPVPEALKRGTVDPASAIVGRALRGGDTPPCTGSDAVFDGRRRYNLHFAPVGPVTLTPQDRSAYAGPAFECTMRLEPVAGYQHGDEANVRAIEQRVTRLWLARPPGIDAWIPVRIDSEISLGNTVGWIAASSLNGRTWLVPLPPVRYEVQRPNTP